MSEDWESESRRGADPAVIGAKYAPNASTAVPGDPVAATQPSAQVIDNPWSQLRRFTRARLALGRAGNSLPTAAHLRFQLDHARATDAVHQSLDVAALRRAIVEADVMRAVTPGEPLLLNSRAPDRAVYLQRPDLGRQLDEADWQRLHERAAALPARIDLSLVIADGLSAAAVQQNALPFLESLLAQLADDNRALTLGPVVIASQGRVAIGDDVGESLNSRAVLVLIGERPGLSSPDSMGAYLTWAPKRGTVDAGRNCISNIRPAGLGVDEAAAKAVYLLREAFRRSCSGVALKDRSHESLSEAPTPGAATSRFRLTEPAADDAP